MMEESAAEAKPRVIYVDSDGKYGIPVSKTAHIIQKNKMGYEVQNIYKHILKRKGVVVRVERVNNRVLIWIPRQGKQPNINPIELSPHE